MAQQGPVDVELPGAPSGPTNPVWPVQNRPWADRPNPWPQDPQSPNDGGRITPPPGQDMDRDADEAI